MAYNRVNWQDKPSTATPINAENLNKMDSGIKDLEDGKIAKTDLVQTDTINNPEKVPSSAVTHALGQQVTQLNNNLADLKPVTPIGGYGNIRDGGYIKLGRIVVLHVQFECTTSVDSVKDIISGIPIPLGSNVPLVTNKPVVGAPLNHAFVTTTGHLRTTVHLTAGTLYNFVGCYISKS